MKTNEVPTPFPSGSTTEPNEPVADPTGQLRLLAPASDELAESSAHARFRLSATTRRRGLRHVAEIRAQLAEAKQRNDRSSNVVSLPPRRQPAA